MISFTATILFPLSLFLALLVARTQAQSNVSGTTPSASASSPSPSVAPTMSAQFPDLAPYSVCVTQCLTNAVAATNCTSITDVNCYCTPPTSQVFTNEMVACIGGLDGCTPPELATAEDLARRFCSIASPPFPSASSAQSQPSQSQSRISLSFPVSATTTVIPITHSASAPLSTTRSNSGSTNPSRTPSASAPPSPSNAAGTLTILGASTSVVGTALLGIFLSFGAYLI